MQWSAPVTVANLALGLVGGLQRIFSQVHVAEQGAVVLLDSFQNRLGQSNRRDTTRAQVGGQLLDRASPQLGAHDVLPSV